MSGGRVMRRLARSRLARLRVSATRCTMRAKGRGEDAADGGGDGGEWLEESAGEPEDKGLDEPGVPKVTPLAAMAAAKASGSLARAGARKLRMAWPTCSCSERARLGVPFSAVAKAAGTAVES